MANRKWTQLLGVLALGVFATACSETTSTPTAVSSFEGDVLQAAAVQEVIDFESNSDGDQNPAVFGDNGSGPITTSATGCTGIAIVYDTTTGAGADPDLDNQSGQGNVLVVEEDLTDADGDGDPDDCASGGSLTLDFSAVDAGGVEVASIVVLDIESDTPADNVQLFGPGDVLLHTVQIPVTTSGDLSPPNDPGDGGIVTLDLGPTAGVTKLVASFDTSGAIDDVVFTPPMRGSNGCTPGFWKNNFGAWAGTGLAPGDSYEATFGVTLSGGDVTLEEALNAKGGGESALLRHSTAALLNALNGFYPLTPAEVIAATQAAFADGSKSAFNAQKDEFDTLNNLGCPLNADESASN